MPHESVVKPCRTCIILNQNQNEYSSKFSEILQEMEIFQTDDEDENREENNDQNENNPLL